MIINLLDFQLKAISDLMEAMEQGQRDIILKSATGSGKTIILTHFMYEYFKSNRNTVFIWLTPGKGDLEEQSKDKMDKYVNGSQTKLLSDVMISGFAENDACFINWEKLTKKGNNALKDSERTNFLEYIEKAHAENLQFKIIIDESHQNDTIKSEEILKYFKTDKIIRTSATPKGYTDAIVIDINEEDVIAQGLIKKLLIINENFDQNIRISSQIAYLLNKAILKQRELYAALQKQKAYINPLIIVQVPNKNDVLLDEVEYYFESQGITYDNGKLAVWLSNKKENLDNIEDNAASPIALIIKQAVATGWDCPRAYILVKLRDNMDETFEIQTIGRIRRMPEAKHYENDLLDSSYLYTLDDKFTEGVKQFLGKEALNAEKLQLKPEHKKFTLTSEQKSGLDATWDSFQVLSAITEYFVKTYNITTFSNTIPGKVNSNAKTNKTKLEIAGYVFSNEIIDMTKSGTLHTLTNAAKNIAAMNDINIYSPLDTHKHGRQFHHETAGIGLKISLEYDQILTIIRKLFDKSNFWENKILSLDIREIYSFTLNNSDRLRHDIQNSISAELTFLVEKPSRITTAKFSFPQFLTFTYDGNGKNQSIMSKNVYQGYRNSAEPRSSSERDFERFCEQCKAVNWIYKNGDKGPEYFSVVYTDNFSKQRSFYPDYIINLRGEIWIIETKGGFDRSGNSEDIDRFSRIKFHFLQSFLIRYHLKGGFIRKDSKSGDLCICMNNYSDDISGKDWHLLSDVFNQKDTNNYFLAVDPEPSYGI
jgi:type III restriction enzyme